MKKNHVNLYKQVIAVTSDYLGPAAPRFIDRQIANHLSKTPNELVPQDMPTLINWTRSALALLTDDHKIINEFADRLGALTTRHEARDAAIKQ